MGNKECFSTKLPWEIDIALRYYPIVKFLKIFYSSEIEILEVGSGDRGITAFFEIPITAVDVSFSEEIDNKLVTKVVSSVENIPFEEKTFDIVISIDMFEHLSKDIRKLALKEFFRVVKPDGKIVIAVPCGELSSLNEKILNSIYKFFKRKEHPWLKEHISCGLPNWKEVYEQIKVVNNKCQIEVINNLNVFLWFWLYLLGAILPVSLRQLIMRMIFPIVRNINFLPYRKIFFVNNK